VNARIETKMALSRDGARIPLNAPLWFWNLFAQQAVFVLRR
jgi:hypothetical protein